MATASLGMARVAQTGQLLIASVEDNGSASHPWCGNPDLLRGEDSARSLSDLIHYLCTLHGRYPGVIDHSSTRAVEPASRAWLAQATYAFAGERAYLARLAVAAGPVPSTPGAASTDTTIIAQRHAMEMLAQSERHGCALGTAMAIVLDWAHVRTVLDAAAIRFGVEPPPYMAGDVGTVATLADAFAGSAAVQRALLFGAQQVLLQHRGLWDVLEARHEARRAG